MTVEKVEQQSTDVKPAAEQQQAGESNKQYDDRMAAMQTQIESLIAENKTIVAFNNTMKEEKRLIAEKAKADILNIEVKTKEDFDNVVKQYKSELEARDAKLSEIAKEKQEARLEQKAKELAQGLTKHAGKLNSLTKEIKDRIRLADDGNVQVLDKQGNLTISSVDVLVNGLKSEFDYLIDVVQSTGGGAHSNAGNAAKSFNEMNSDEKVALWNSNRPRYLELETAAKAK
jgi:hypothetical protein